MVYICYSIAQAYYPPFRRCRAAIARVVQYSIAHLKRKIKPLPVFKLFDYPKALFIMPESSGYQRIEHFLPRMAERSVPKVMPHGYCFCQVLVQPKSARYRARYLAYLQRVRQPRAVMVANRRKEHLCFMLQPAK